MSEKASGNEKSSDPDLDFIPDIPGLPAGEELAVDPSGGDEIDPLPKWWNESIEPAGERVENRRIEEGIEITAPRRKVLRSLQTEEPETTNLGEDRPDPLEALATGTEALGPVKAVPPLPELEIELPARPAPPDLPELDQPNPANTKAPAWLEEEPLESVEPTDAPEDLAEAIDAVAPDLDLSQLQVVALPVEMSEPAKEILVEETPAEEVKPEPEVIPEPVPEEIPAPVTAIDSPEVVKEEKPLPEIAAVEPIDEKILTEATPAIAEPVADEQPAAAPVPPTRKAKAGCWSLFATAYVVLTLLLLVLILGAAFFASSRMSQVGADAVEMAKTKLAEQGLHLDHSDWSYSFPRGVVFDEVTVYEDESKTRTALKITRLGVNVDLLALATKGGAVDSAEFSLEDSNITLYEAGNRSADLTGASGEVLATGSQVVVERFAARVGGLELRLRGAVKLRGPGAATPDGEAAPGPGEKKSALAGLDFSAFRKWQPWFAIEGIGDEVPVMEVEFSMDAGDPGLTVLDGTFNGGRMKWQTLEFGGASIRFRVDPAAGVLSFPQVMLLHGSGSIGGSLSIDTTTLTLKVERLQSSVDLVALISSYDPTWAEEVKAVRFVDAPVVSVSGEVPLGDPSFSRLEIRYTHPRGLIWTSSGRELALADIRGDFKYDRGAIETNNAAARIFGGRIEVNGATNLLRDGRPFSGLVELTGANLEPAAQWFGQEKSGLSGRLDIVFRGTGTSELASVNGGGTLRIEQANLTGFPMIGRVREQVGAVLPVLTGGGSGALTSAYIIESGVLVTSDLTLLQGGLRTVVNGSVNLVTRATNFTARVDLAPELAGATGLEDKAVVVEGTGNLDQPVLKIREFPVEFASSALSGVLGSTPESLLKLQGLLPAENAAQAITGSLEDVEKIGIDPAVTGFLRGLIGGEEPRPAPAIRAVPQN